MKKIHKKAFNKSKELILKKIKKSGYLTKFHSYQFISSINEFNESKEITNKKIIEKIKYIKEFLYLYDSSRVPFVKSFGLNFIKPSNFKLQYEKSLMVTHFEKLFNNPYFFHRRNYLSYFIQSKLLDENYFNYLDTTIFSIKRTFHISKKLLLAFFHNDFFGNSLDIKNLNYILSNLDQDCQKILRAFIKNILNHIAKNCYLIFRAKIDNKEKVLTKDDCLNVLHLESYYLLRFTNLIYQQIRFLLPKYGHRIQNLDRGWVCFTDNYL